jgi:lactate permease
MTLIDAGAKAEPFEPKGADGRDVTNATRDVINVHRTTISPTSYDRFGGLIAIIVALWTAPIPMTPAALAVCVGKGLWLAWLVVAVILSGLFFREVISLDVAHTAEGRQASALEGRRRAFFACFLVGPFAEAATGFGVGQVTTVAMLQSIGLPSLYVVLLGLFSQVLVSWGAMANGTMVGAAFAGIAPRELGVHSAMLTVPAATCFRRS